MKTSSYKIIYAFIIFNPVIRIVFSFLTHNMFMNIFYFVYTSVLLMLYCCCNSVRVSHIIFFELILLDTIMQFLYIKDENLAETIIMICFFILMQIYSNKKIRNETLEYLLTHKYQYLIACFVYLFVLLCSVLRGEGISSGWGTHSLCGPYLLNHILAYELLILIAANMILYNYTRQKIYFLLCGVFCVLNLLTAVRTTLLVMIIILAYYFVKCNFKKQIFYIIVLCAFLGLMYNYTNVFTPLIEKTQTAINIGSISNSRPIIYASSLNAYFTNNNNILNKIFGCGWDYLLNYNYSHIRLAIQAHNDFINMFVAFGPIIFIFYCSNIICFCRGRDWIWIFAIITTLAFFNGMEEYTSFMSSIIMIRILFDYFNNGIQRESAVSKLENKSLYIIRE